MKFYYRPGSCAMLPYIVLEDSGADYEAIKVDDDTLYSEEYKKINPRNQVPSLISDAGEITDRAVWLTWLRYEQARLLELLRQLPELEAVTGLTFKVRPIVPPRVPISQPRALSSQAADELSSCARDTDNPRLKRALERLAAHAEPSTGAD